MYETRSLSDKEKKYKYIHRGFDDQEVHLKELFMSGLTPTLMYVEEKKES